MEVVGLMVPELGGGGLIIGLADWNSGTRCPSACSLCVIPFLLSQTYAISP
jgi:hypothetical protein